mgnify:CR=1 FL=1
MENIWEIKQGKWKLWFSKRCKSHKIKFLQFQFYKTGLTKKDYNYLTILFEVKLATRWQTGCFVGSTNGKLKQNNLYWKELQDFPVEEHHVLRLSFDRMIWALKMTFIRGAAFEETSDARKRYLRIQTIAHFSPWH